MRFPTIMLFGGAATSMFRCGPSAVQCAELVGEKNMSDDRMIRRRTGKMKEKHGAERNAEKGHAQLANLVEKNKAHGNRRIQADDILQPPLTTTRASEIYDVIYETMGPLEPGSPYYQTALWIIEVDPMQLEADADNLIQRYTLALFWFQTTNNGSEEWLSCNPPAGPGENETCVYQYIMRQPDDSMAYSDVPNRTRWLSGKHECEWVGVWCLDEHFIGIVLEGQNMTGTIPSELATLEFFSFGILSFNLLTGSIPSEWARAPYLFMVEVMNNLLTGPIPRDFFAEGAGLWELNPSQNLITGTIPTEIGHLTELTNLYIFDTDMEGPIPTEIGRATDLVELWLYDNQFTGLIPTEIGLCTKLENLFLFRNNLIGTIPSEVGNLARTEFLKIDSNPGIGGGIPEELYNMSALFRLDLYDLQLAGTISTRVGLLTNLISLELRGNQLRGTIPSEIGNLQGLVKVWLHFNEFLGPVPDEVCSISGLLSVPSAQLVADCAPEDDPADECACCTACCDRDTKECSLVD